MDQWLLHMNFPRNWYGPMALKVLWKFQSWPASVHRVLFPENLFLINVWATLFFFLGGGLGAVACSASPSYVLARTVYVAPEEFATCLTSHLTPFGVMADTLMSTFSCANMLVFTSDGFQLSSKASAARTDPPHPNSSESAHTIRASWITSPHFTFWELVD